eukprot:CAMPEP_0195092376 /NCGR_PEP_ID=MMETSP0448-20130528/36387_1 /TAXON_ID=66468 /ORGANISM="Heterocapsa triquestra, Strain CCMP 448" /LENGTH=37 /DNA_ID= /DNA_START= /DNA_END= /DNA_ORIENTATION=
MMDMGDLTVRLLHSGVHEGDFTLDWSPHHEMLWPPTA